jgi:hypothetical protein
MIAVNGNADVVIGRDARLGCFTLDVGQQALVGCLLELGATLGALKKAGCFELDNYVVVTAVLLGSFGIEVDAQRRLQR